MADNPHFARAANLREAESLLAFPPKALTYSAGYAMQSIQVHIRDHKLRELPIAQRTLELHFGGFVFSQAQYDVDESRRLALKVSYGSQPKLISVAGRDGRAYALGPAVAPDDVDGRMPAVVVWHEQERFYLLASTELPHTELLAIGGSVYA